MSKNLKQIIEDAGRSIQPNFSIQPEQEQYYEQLYNYFEGKFGDLDHKKGLLICGGVGTGKTLSMQIMQRMFGGYSIVSSRHVVREFMIEGVEVVDRYGRKSFILQNGNIDPKRPKHVCFDDILLEEANAKFYGNQQNLMAEILLDRYEMFSRHGMKTYATSNADMKTLELNYGVRVRDRIREMMNYITLTGNSYRK